MEQNSNSDELSESELRDAGASAAYIAYYKTAKDMGVETNSTRHAEKVVRRDVSYSGGHFHEALWSADPRWSGSNPYGADTQNKEILQKAGVYPADEKKEVIA
jgi:hypothetical protein